MYPSQGYWVGLLVYRCRYHPLLVRDYSGGVFPFSTIIIIPGTTTFIHRTIAVAPQCYSTSSSSYPPRAFDCGVFRVATNYSVICTKEQPKHEFPWEFSHCPLLLLLHAVAPLDGVWLNKEIAPSQFGFWQTLYILNILKWTFFSSAGNHERRK